MMKGPDICPFENGQCESLKLAMVKMKLLEGVVKGMIVNHVDDQKITKAELCGGAKIGDFYLRLTFYGTATHEYDLKFREPKGSDNKEETDCPKCGYKIPRYPSGWESLECPECGKWLDSENEEPKGLDERG